MTKLFKILPLLLVGLICSQSAQAANELVKLSDRAYAYLGTSDFSPGNSYGANAGIVIGDNGILVIDTLASSRHAQEFIAAIKKVSDKPIKYVLNTHFHMDHSFGNSDFEAVGATVISHHMALSYMKKWSQKILDKGWSGLKKEEIEGTKVAYPTVTFQDSLKIDLGGIVPEVIFKIHSHTKGSAIVHLPEQKIVFAGDVLFNDYYANMSASDVTGWLQTIDFVNGLKPEIIVPGHGALAGTKEMVEMKKYLVMFDEKAKEFAADSTDIAAVQKKLIGVLPHKSHGENSIKNSLKWKYMRKKK